MLLQSAGFDLLIDRTLSVATNAISYLEIPIGFLCTKLSLSNEATTSGYDVFFCGSNETMSVTGGDVTHVDANAVTGATGQFSVAARTITDVSAAAAAVITSNGHGFANITGNRVYITGVVDDGPGGDLDLAINGKVWAVTYVGANSFSIPLASNALTNVYASGGTAQIAANSHNGKFVRIGAASPYEYHKIAQSNNSGLFYSDGVVSSDTSAQIVALPLQDCKAGVARDAWFAGERSYFQFKSIGGTVSLQVVAHCMRG